MRVLVVVSAFAVLLTAGAAQAAAPNRWFQADVPTPGGLLSIFTHPDGTFEVDGTFAVPRTCPDGSSGLTGGSFGGAVEGTASHNGMSRADVEGGVAAAEGSPGIIGIGFDTCAPDGGGHHIGSAAISLRWRATGRPNRSDSAFSTFVPYPNVSIVSSSSRTGSVTGTLSVDGQSLTPGDQGVLGVVSYTQS